jgi:hypothetical protein
MCNLITRSRTQQALVAAFSLLLMAGPTTAQEAPADPALDPLIHDAMLYAYPYNEFMQMRHTALNDKSAPTYTTLNHFRHERHLATPQDRWANAPITDTLYSTNWLDVGSAPVVLSLPDTAGRYYVIAMIGADLNTFAYVGRRLSGTAARRVAIVAPDWQGAVPAADQVIRAPTRDIYFNMRVLVENPEDLARAHALQDKFTTTPASAKRDDPQQVPLRGDWGRFVDVANEALARNPPPAREKALLQRLSEVGICGSNCSWAKLSPALQTRWQDLAPGIEKELKGTLNANRRVPDNNRKNGWIPYRLPNSFGSNYNMRAASAAMSGGILGLEAAEATYFVGNVDGDNQALGDGVSYSLRLPEGRLPADAFWSISLYEFAAGGQYLLDNPIGRHTISDRTQGLKFNSDGSLDIWIQPTEPGPDKRANWLPSPANNRFYLFARAYQPWPMVLDPQWSLESINKRAP